MSLEKLSIGRIDVHGLRDGFFHLDGGAMFGVVPKTLWSKKFPPDNQNRITLGLNSILIKNRKHLILVETGIGKDIPPKFQKFYSVKRKPGLEASIQNMGYQLDDIDFVINTHLHFDHCGGNTYRDRQGEIRPTFPKAQYIIQKEEWDNALNPSPRDKPSYIPDNFLPLKKHGNLQLVEGDRSISEGVTVKVIPGHTSHHQCVQVKSDGETLMFLGDMVPTSAHIGLSYVMSYDLFPRETIENKRKVFDQAIQNHWILAFNHDPRYYFGKVRKKDHKYVFQVLEG